ncbi:peptidoglycan DD-metalloendopeptidase family protein [Priestia megaterium]|uniref:aggregation-promoting factor C-terminal-like domain-containing protein n=1 Tax=Priestia megaterium TaxID=1404 RepID=UPI001F13C8A4|nr:peptidoglycan DD-metalloendopeptidase family protein [Priestia megaterium]UMZ35549.1 peptidoglycan DD-metalloendopeptidase family protein [Priestia megaterium]
MEDVRNLAVGIEVTADSNPLKEITDTMNEFKNEAQTTAKEIQKLGRTFTLYTQSATSEVQKMGQTARQYSQSAVSDVQKMSSTVAKEARSTSNEVQKMNQEMQKNSRSTSQEFEHMGETFRNQSDTVQSESHKMANEYRRNTETMSNDSQRMHQEHRRNTEAMANESQKMGQEHRKTTEAMTNDTQQMANEHRRNTEAMGNDSQRMSREHQRAMRGMIDESHALTDYISRQSDVARKLSSTMGMSATHLADQWSSMSQEMRKSLIDNHNNMMKYKRDLMDVEQNMFKLGNQMGDYKGTTGEFMDEIYKLGKEHKKVSDAMINANVAGRQSIIQQVAVMSAMSGQSEKIAKNYDKFGNSLTRANKPLLNITSGLERMARQGSAAQIALEMLGPNAKMKDLQDMIGVITQGIMRQQMVLLAAGAAWVGFTAIVANSAMGPDVSENLAAQAKAWTDYRDAVNTRTQEIIDTWGLFEKVQLEKTSPLKLLSNLQGQVKVMRDWSKNLNSLASKGLDEGFIASLRKMGPEAAGQIAALNKMSQPELNKYVALWKEKHQLARKAAVTELDKLRQQTELKVKNLQSALKPLGLAVEDFKGTWSDAVAPFVDTWGQIAAVVVKIGTAIGEVFNTLNSISPAITKMIGMFTYLTSTFLVLLSPLAVGIGYFGGLRAAFAGLWPIIGPFVVGFAAVAGSAMVLAGAFLAVGAALQDSWENSQIFRGMITGAFSGVSSVLKPVADIAKNIISAIAGWEYLSPVVLGLAAAFGTLKVISLSSAAIQLFTNAQKRAAIQTKLMTLLTKGWAIAQRALNLSLLANPFVAIAAALVGIGVALALAYDRSETFRNIVNGVWDSIKAKAMQVWGFIGPYIKQAMTIINTFVQQKLGLLKMWWNQTSQGILQIIRNVWGFISPYINQAISAVTNFVHAKLIQLEAFWDNNGQQILQAVKNIWSFIATVMKTVLATIVTVVKAAFAVIVPVVKVALGLIFLVVKAVLPNVLNVFKSVFQLLVTLIKSIWGNIQGIINGALDMIMGLVKVFAGLFTGDWSKMWEGIKQIFSGSLGIISNLFSALINILKYAWGVVKTVVSEGAKAIVSVLSAIWDKIKGPAITAFNAIKDFLIKWGPLILAIVTGPIGLLVYAIAKNWDAIKSATITAFNAVKDFLVKWGPLILAVITGPIGLLVYAIVKNWDTIKSATISAFNTVKDFLSSVFNGIKSVVTSVVTAIVSGVKQWWTNLQNNTIAIFNAVKSFLSSVWSGIKSTITTWVTAIFTAVKQWWANLQNNTITVFNAVKSFLSSVWSGIKSTITTWVTAIFTAVKQWWTNLQNNTVSIFNAVWSFLRGLWNNIYKGISGYVSNIVSGIRSGWTTAKDKTVEIFNNMKNHITTTFNNIVDGAKSLPGKIGQGIKSMAGKAMDGVHALGSKLATGLENIVNKITQDGINNGVLKKLGVKDHLIPRLDIPGYAHGTSGHPGGLAMLGDGRGSNAGPELYRTPDGRMGLSPATDTLMNLPKGTQVLSATNTRKVMPNLPFYDNGNTDIKSFASGALDSIKGGANKAINTGKEVAGSVANKTKDVAGKAKDLAFDVWDYASEPSKLMNKIFDSLNLKLPNISGFFGQIASSSVKKVKDGAIQFVGKKMNEYMSMFGGDGASGTGIGSYYLGSPFRITTRFTPGGNKNDKVHKGGVHHGLDLAAPQGTPIKSLTDGIVKQVLIGSSTAGNGVRIQSGSDLLSYIHMMSAPSVKQGQHVKEGQLLGRVGSTGFSTGPHLDLKIKRNGAYINPLTYLQGKAGGGGGSAPSGNLAQWISAGMARAGVSGTEWRNGLNWIIQKESSGNPRAVGAPTSDGTAKGLMQLKHFNYKGDPFNPANNIYWGIKYIKDRYKSIGGALSWWRSHNWYKNGTGIGGHSGGSAILGDGGKNEPFMLPNGQLGLSPNVSTLFPDLPKGTMVWSSLKEFFKQYNPFPKKEDKGNGDTNNGPSGDDSPSMNEFNDTPSISSSQKSVVYSPTITIQVSGKDNEQDIEAKFKELLDEHYKKLNELMFGDE